MPKFREIATVLFMCSVTHSVPALGQGVKLPNGSVHFSIESATLKTIFQADCQRIEAVVTDRILQCYRKHLRFISWVQVSQAQGVDTFPLALNFSVINDSGSSDINLQLAFEARIGGVRVANPDEFSATTIYNQLLTSGSLNVPWDSMANFLTNQVKAKFLTDSARALLFASVLRSVCLSNTMLMHNKYPGKILLPLPWDSLEADKTATCFDVYFRPHISAGASASNPGTMDIQPLRGVTDSLCGGMVLGQIKSFSSDDPPIFFPEDPWTDSILVVLKSAMNDTIRVYMKKYTRTINPGTSGALVTEFQR